MQTVEDLGLYRWVIVTASGKLIRTSSEKDATILLKKLDENAGAYQLITACKVV